MKTRSLAVGAALLLGACGSTGHSNDVGEPMGGGPPSSKSTAVSPTTARDYTATTGPDCTVGTIPAGRPVPPGCDRLYSPFLAPGVSCIEGQESDCIDPDGDGAFAFIIGGGQCLVERKDLERCRDGDGDGRLDEPLPG